MKIFLVILIILFNSFLSQPFCLNSKKHCSKSNPLTNLCAICQQEDILIPDEDGGCIGSKKCTPGKNYCNECNQNDDLCDICDYGYIADENGGCSYSNFCKISYKGICIECIDDFILVKANNLNICKSILSQDFKNCKKIDNENGVCETCEDNYYLSEDDKKCTKIENCGETIFGNCISCKKGFYLDKNEEKCFNKTNTKFSFCKETLFGQCDKCDDGLYFDENGNCTSSNFCSESFDGKCKKCISGYFLSSNNFCSDTKNCSYADKDTGICLICQNKYYLDIKDYKCKSNLEDNIYKYCAKVENEICTRCEDIFHPTKNDYCSNTRNCNESINGKCISCLDNFYLGLDNYCTKVEHCIYSSYYVCSECEDGYYYSTQNKICKEYDEIFEGCKYSNKLDEFCQECKDNFYFNYKDSLCHDNTQNNQFYKCSYSDEEGNICDICKDGYYLGSEDKKCSKIKNCKLSENENKCLECDEDYCLDVSKQICIDNYNLDITKKQYFTCIRTNDEGTSCEKCQEGYEVNEEGYCVDVEQCEEKVDGICVRCKDKVDENGKVYKYCANNVFGCVNTYYYNCLNCNNLEQIHRCTECNEGYKINIFGSCQIINED